VLTHTDENTGREIRQLTAFAAGAWVPYFRTPRNLPDGRVLGYSAHATGHLIAVDPESGDVQPLTTGPGQLLRLREGDGVACFYDGDARRLWTRTLPDGEPQPAGSLDADILGTVQDITCDGRTLIGVSLECEPSDMSGLYGRDFRHFWRWIYRKRSAVIWAYDLESGRYAELLRMEEYQPQHIDASPTDPGLLKYAQDGLALFDQRIHTMRVDGTEWRMIRPQAAGEWVHHEFWWPGAQWIGYKYMDRRNDPTIHELPWGEYAPRPLHLGIADLEGDEIYCSDPLGSYHSHLNVSPNPKFRGWEWG